MRSPAVIITIFFLCAIFFFLGFLSYSKFYGIALPAVDGIRYNMDLASIGSNQDMFAFVFALVPLLLFITWQLIPLQSTDKKTASAFVVLICMALTTYIRYKMLVADFNEMLQSQTNKYSTGITFSFQDLNYEFYLLGGLLVGCIISYLLFHNKVVRRTIFVGGD
ncbi:MAG: hypothetical protein V4685_15785 [Bacteroidota bacterium]